MAEMVPNLIKNISTVPTIVVVLWIILVLRDGSESLEFWYEGQKH